MPPNRHLLRDYVTQASSQSSSTFIGSYLTSIFLRRVLLYTYVGDTNYPINPVGTLLVSTADTTPTAATPTFAVGTRAGINLSSSSLSNVGKEFYVSIPNVGAGGRNVVLADVGRILVLRSTSNPQFNSGCFLIDGYDPGTNSYAVDYRSGTNISGSTFIASGSNNVGLPTGTINVLSTTGFTGSGSITVQTSVGFQQVNYTSTNATQFLGCTLGTGVMSTGGMVAQQVTFPQATLNVVSTTGFTPSGTLFIESTTGRQTVTYTGTTATTFTGVAVAAGGTYTGNAVGTGLSPIVQAFTTTITAGSNGQTFPLSNATLNVSSVFTNGSTTIAVGSNNAFLPQGTINVASTTGFPSSGTIYVTTTQGVQTVAYTNTSGGNQFTGCTGGIGQMVTGNQVYYGFPPSGYIFVATTTNVQMVSYTGVTSNTFTGCNTSPTATGSLATNGVVYFSPSVPIIELADSMNWYLYEKDSNVPTTGASNTNTNTQYRGFGNSTNPRIILQSPNSNAWQVRICHETLDDAGYGGVSSECPIISMIPGFNGDIHGDFQVGGPHLHTPLYYNSNSTAYTGAAPGIGDNLNVPSGTSTEIYRITIVGDDGYSGSGGTAVTIFGRRPGDAASPRSYMMVFGMPENEPLPIPPNTDARLYALGSGSSTGSGQSLNDVSWYTGTLGNQTMQGVTKQFIGTALPTNSIPMSCNVSLLGYVVGNGQQGSPIFDGSAADTPWMGATELFSVDIISGVTQGWNGTAVAFPYFEGRYMGTIPHIRVGRANYGEYTLSTDTNRGFQHMRRGIWMLWGGPPVIT